MPWRKVTPMSERLNFCKLAGEKSYSISRLAEDFGISRKTAYKWLKRYKEEGEAGIFDRSRCPKSSPSSLSDDTIEAIIELKKQYPMWGPRKLHKLLVNRAGESLCSRSSVDRTLARYGLRDRRERSPLEEAVGRFERGRPNELWQIDFTSPFTLVSGQKVWPVPILDDHSRYCVGLIAAPACSGRYALDCFKAAASVSGLPDEVLSDHGGAFGTSRAYVSSFTAFMWACGVEHVQGRYAHPQTQGKLERFNQTLQRECIRRYSYNSIDDWNKCFDEFRYIYNNIRPHQSLLDCTPASRYAASKRGFVEPDRNFREPEIDVHRRVDCSGKIWLLQHHLKVSSGLGGWIVSARDEGLGIWSIIFRGRLICQARLAKPAKYKPRP
jgi:transposase InsO family protein